MVSPIDNNICKELANNVETLTHTGQKSLDSAVLKKIKSICKLSDGYVEHAYHLLIYQLEKQHAEIRYSAFQICNELFRRSHCFRELLVSNMQHIMELTTESSPYYPLPPPRAIALNLKRLALQTIKEWSKEFGHGYKKLHLGYNFLKHCKKVDFIALEMENSSQRVRQQEIERRQEILNKDRMKKVTTEMNELQPEIANTLTAMENCIALLLPSLEDFFIIDDNGTKDDKNCLSTDKNKGESQNSSGDIIKIDHQEKEQASTSSDCDNVNIVKKEKEGMKNATDAEDYISDDDDYINFRAHGMLNSKYSIEVMLNPGTAAVIKETPENAAIFENARDLHTLINNRYLPCVKKWVQIITKSSGSSDHLKKVIDLKKALEDIIKKYSKLNILPVSKTGSDSSDSDFEEVAEKEGYEDSVREDLSTVIPKDFAARSINYTPVKAKQPEWSIWSKENQEKDPTTAHSTLVTLASTKIDDEVNKEKCRTDKNSNNNNNNNNNNNGQEKTKGTSEKPRSAEIEPKPSTSKAALSEDSRKSKLLAVAPKLPFDIDLYHWEDEHLTAPTMLAVKAEGSRFWAATSADDLEEIAVPDGSACLRTRVIEFSGNYEPVKWTCRAPLTSGKLCPRRDRYKCPFHGPIVARDATGKCSNPEDEKRLEIIAEEEQRQCPDWQDPQLLQEIKEATGLDLKMPEKKKNGKRKKKKKAEEKYPGLTDISAKQNTALTRLSKKIFKTSAMKRVASALDKADHKRFRDKYGDQFNYMHNTS